MVSCKVQNVLGETNYLGPQYVYVLYAALKDFLSAQCVHPTDQTFSGGSCNGVLLSMIKVVRADFAIGYIYYTGHMDHALISKFLRQGY